VERFFPGLAEYLGCSRRAALPLYNRRFFSKSVWDVAVGGVPGLVNWVVAYPSLLDALTGGPTAAECELSFRLKRRAMEARGGRGALDALAAAAQALHDAGWDTGQH
jgi:hypothetical protein